MSTAASRQARSARNAMAEALGLGETWPLRDLPVTVEPPIVPFGGTALILVEDSERDVLYLLLDQAGAPLPDGAAPEAAGTGALLAIETPPIVEDATFTLRATRPNGHSALLIGTAPIKVGLDATLPVAAVSAGGPPVVVDHGASLEVEVGASQEGVTYRLVGRPSPDPASPDDFAALAQDVALSAEAGVEGTGGAIRLVSVPLDGDARVHVRAVKRFGGAGARPPQTTLLAASLPAFVRAATDLVARAAPAVVEHGAPAAIEVEGSQPGVEYLVHVRAIADAEFSRVEPPDPATLAAATDDGEARIVVPPPTAVWEGPPGFEPVGPALAGNGGRLAVPLASVEADSLALVEARKAHGGGADAFTSSERLDRPAAVLARPDPRPGLRLEATLAEGKLVRLRALAGQRGVFYSLAADGEGLGDLFLHQLDPADAALNKGVGALAVSVDFVVAEAGSDAPTSVAPPPAPSLDVAPMALPAAIAIGARRAMTGLTAELGEATVAPMPEADAPAAVQPGGSASVRLSPARGERYALLVNGRRVGEPVVGGARRLTLETGALAEGDRVELWAAGEDAGMGAVLVERRTPLAVSIG